MKTAPATYLPDPRAESEALIKEARRRQRRRHVAAGLAAAALLASAAGVLVGMHGPGSRHPSRPGPQSHPTPPVPPRPAVPAPAPIPRNVDTEVLMWPAGFGQCCGPVAVDNLSTGRLAQMQEPAISAGDYQPLLTQAGRWLVYVSNGATAIRDDLSGKPRALAPTPFFAPSADPRHVWISRFRTGMRSPIHAWLVPVTGGPPSPRVTLPAEANLPVIRGTEAGLLLQGRQRLVLWNPGSAPKKLPYSPGDSDGFDASSRLVAYGTGCSAQGTTPGAAVPNAGYETCEMLRILNVVTGKLTSFAAPTGTVGWVPNGFNLVSAISRGDRMIAAYAAVRPPGQGLVRLYVMPITSRSGRAKAVPSSAADLFARTAWSTKGSWLLYQGPGGHLWAYQVTSGKTRASSTPCCRYTVMVAVPSHSG